MNVPTLTIAVSISVQNVPPMPEYMYVSIKLVTFLDLFIKVKKILIPNPSG